MISVKKILKNCIIVIHLKILLKFNKSIHWQNLKFSKRVLCNICMYLTKILHLYNFKENTILTNYHSVKEKKENLLTVIFRHSTVKNILLNINCCWEFKLNKIIFKIPKYTFTNKVLIIENPLLTICFYDKLKIVKKNCHFCLLTA